MIYQKKSDVLHLMSILFWILNVLHGVFTYWAITGDIEMMALLPIFFIEIPSAILVIIELIALLAVKSDKKDKLVNFIPVVIYALQIAAFWLGIHGIL